MATVTNPNAAAKAGNGLGPKTVIVSSTVATQAVLDNFVRDIGALGYTVAAIAGAHGGTMHFALQGTDTLSTAELADGGITTGIDLTVVCTFDQA
jgi:hypothetical protein